jgi:hypothetical protein
MALLTINDLLNFRNFGMMMRRTLHLRKCHVKPVRSPGVQTDSNFAMGQPFIFLERRDGTNAWYPEKILTK